jgi:hypothetical protein
MRKEELIKQLQEHEPLLANAVSHMVEYIQDRYPAAYPSRVQTEAVNDYLRSVYADRDGNMSELNCEHRRIASQKITIAAIRVLNSRQLDRLQDVLESHTTGSIICRREDVGCTADFLFWLYHL